MVKTSSLMSHLGTVLLSCKYSETMPRYQPNTRFSDCWSSVGNITFYHRNGVCYYKTKPRCKFKGTPDQLKNTEIHQRALASWRTLSHQTQLQWNECAKEVRPHRPPFNGTGHITGHNLFVSAYHGFAQLGNEHIPQPAKWTAFPIFTPEFTSAEERSNGLVLTFRLHLQNPVTSSCRLHLRLQLTKPGSGLRPGLMKTYLAQADCNADEDTATVIIPHCRSQWQLQSDTIDAHCRFSLIDIRTGYRSQYQKAKFENIVIPE